MKRNYKLSKRSLRNLEGVSSELVSVVKLAITETDIDFVVIEGLRSPERQKELFEAGFSQTLNSKHLTGKAVDLAPWVNNTIDWGDRESFKKVRDAVFLSAEKLNVKLLWGGDWGKYTEKENPFFDAPHFEILE